ncbi:MAG: glycosyltransferase family 39 protein [Myxococcota bacterium]
MARRPNVALWLWLFVFGATLVTTGTMHVDGDSRLMCAAAASVTDHFGLDVEGQMRRDVVYGPDGKYYSSYPILPILACVPGRSLGWLGRQVSPALGHLLAGVVPAAFSATSALLFFFLARRFRCRPSLAVGGALMLAFSTFLWAYGRKLYSEQLQALLVIACLLASLRAKERPTRGAFFLLGLMGGLAIHVKTPLAILGVGAFIHQVRGGMPKKRWIDMLVFGALGAVPLAALWLGYNHLRTGDVLDSAYNQGQSLAIGLGVPLLAGLHGLLMSSGKSIFLYAPILLLSGAGFVALWRRERGEFWLFMVPLVGLFAVSAKWWDWSGDWGWGPRLLAPAVPLMLLPALLVMKRGGGWLRSGALLGAAGFLINGLGAIISDAHYTAIVWRATRASLRIPRSTFYVRDDLVIPHFVPEMSPVVGHGWLLKIWKSGEWSADAWYPWKSLGLPGWRPTGDVIPPHLNLWFDTPGAESWMIGASSVLVAVLGLLLFVSLWRQRAANVSNL